MRLLIIWHFLWKGYIYPQELKERTGYCCPRFWFQNGRSSYPPRCALLTPPSIPWGSKETSFKEITSTVPAFSHSCPHSAQKLLLPWETYVAVNWALASWLTLLCDCMNTTVCSESSCLSTNKTPQKWVYLSLLITFQTTSCQNGRLWPGKGSGMLENNLEFMSVSNETRIIKTSQNEGNFLGLH